MRASFSLVLRNVLFVNNFFFFKKSFSFFWAVNFRFWLKEERNQEQPFLIDQLLAMLSQFQWFALVFFVCSVCSLAFFSSYVENLKMS